LSLPGHGSRDDGSQAGQSHDVRAHNEFDGTSGNVVQAGRIDLLNVAGMRKPAPPVSRGTALSLCAAAGAAAVAVVFLFLPWVAVTAVGKQYKSTHGISLPDTVDVFAGQLSTVVPSLLVAAAAVAILGAPLAAAIRSARWISCMVAANAILVVVFAVVEILYINSQVDYSNAIFPDRAAGDPTFLDFGGWLCVAAALIAGEFGVIGILGIAKTSQSRPYSTASDPRASSLWAG